MVTDTFFPVSVERLGLIVQDTPMHDEGQQVADELIEVEELVEDELDAEQETETDAEPAAEVGIDAVDDEAAADDFQVCVVGHQLESEPGPGPGPSLGPFCSDILSWLRCCRLVTRLVASRSSRKRTASLRRALLLSPLRIIGSYVWPCARLMPILRTLRITLSSDERRGAIFLSFLPPLSLSLFLFLSARLSLLLHSDDLAVTVTVNVCRTTATAQGGEEV